MTTLPADVRVRAVAPQDEPGTVLPARLPDADRPVPPRRRLGGVTTADRLNAVGAAASGLSVALLLFGRLAPFSGPLGFVLVAYLVTMVTYAVLVSLTEEGPVVRDKLMTVLLGSAALVTFTALTFVIAFILIKGYKALTHLNFYTQDMSRAGPLDPVTVGGIKHALIGTLWMIGIALMITVPLGISAAVYINEVGGRVSRFVRTVVDAMTALPSIIAGLFVYATWILALHKEKSALAAAMAISVMMLPIIIRASDVVLRLVPGNLREASSALGAPQWRTVWHVVLPTARSGLATAVILGTARGIGETAPVILTAGFTAALNTNPTHGPMVSLPLAAFEFVQSPQKAMVARGFATAAFLMLVVLALFVLARVLGGRGPGYLSRGQVRRIRRASAGDLARMEARAAAAEVRPEDELGPEDEPHPEELW
jgi:phosphate transport system permease protein